MRRTTSALTTTILGAVLSASTVSAQQSLPSATARQGGTATTTAPASGSKSVAEADPSFGMAAARGARHLLRNGLDYVDYQEFDRALKYLREAEKRQGELNDPEKLKLKQAIERAQRGLRESIGSTESYALSDRSRRSSGFAPATADTRIAAAPSQSSRTNSRPTAVREGDDRAEPIQLASAELPVPSSAPGLLPPVPGGAGLTPTEPSPLPEIPQRPEMPGIEAAQLLDQADLVEVEAPTSPPVTRIESRRPSPAPVDAASQAQADLFSPLPTLDAAEPAPLPVDPAVTRSNTGAAPIFLENPTESVEKAAAPSAPAQAPASAPAQAPAPAPAVVDSFDLPPLGTTAARPTVPDDLTDEALPTAPAPAAELEAPAAMIADSELDLPALPAELREQKQAAAAQPLPEAADDLPTLPDDRADAPATDALAQPSPVAAQPEVLPDLPEQADDEPQPVAAPTREPFEAPVQESAPAPAPAATYEADELAEPAPTADAPEFVPAPAPVAAPAAARPTQPNVLDSLLPTRANPVSTLTPELQNRVDQIARKMEDEYRQNQVAPTTAPAVPEGAVRDVASDLRSQTQVDISRAPSPAEARPIHAIPVPEDWVPLGAREWGPQRKYWSAAATCHLPLYFQDPMLERYGHSVENYIGPKGRFFAYPVDNHKQSTQRNQMAQPFASVGLFAFQILTLPYAMVVDPPWEAQYDLGYWRPGDKIPTDMYYLPLHGTGPPLKGIKY